VQLGEGVEWALHSCIVLAVVPPDRALPAAKLAELHALPAAYLAKHLQALSQAGIVEAVAGRRGGYRLGRPAADISVLDVVEAVEGAAPSFRCNEIRRQGPAAAPRSHYTGMCSINRVMRTADAAWRDALSAVSLQDLVAQTAASISPVSIRKSAQFLQEAMR
jgi:Rrf2 family protein